MPRINLIVFSIIIYLNCIAYSDSTKTPEQYWKETGLNFSIIGDHLRASCYKDARGYLACVQGLNVVANLLKPAAVFATPGEAAKNPAIYGALVKRYGPYNLYQILIQPTATSVQSAWDQQKLVRSAQIEAAQQVFRSHGMAVEFKFADVLSELKPQVIKGDLGGSEALIAARVFNTILQSAIDPHTHIDPKAEMRDQAKSSDQSYAGIGVSLTAVAGNAVVRTPMRGSPALEAGLKAQDIIDSVNGQKINGSEVSAVSGKIKGPEGTTVTLGIIRDGKPMEFKVIRRNILVKNVDSRFLNDTGKVLGYVKLANFMEDKACQEIANAISTFQSKGVTGMILDLRDDPGGLLDQAVCIGSLFVGNQVIVRVKGINGGEFKDYNGLNDQFTHLPLVTLINGGSASASEILAGALQDYGRSWIVGERSFGKASVQQGSTWGGAPGIDSIAIYNTIERFYEPSGRTNQIVGILPDFPVDPVPHATADDKFALREADYYTNALPPLGAPWVEPRPALVAKIQECMKASQLADAIYQREKNDAIAPDYQLVSSEVILGCQ